MAGRLARAGRRTNVALLVLLAGAFGTGWLAFATGASTRAAVIVTAHGVAGLALIGLVPWKSVIIRRARRWPAPSVALLVTVLVCLAAGFVEVFGGYGVIAGLSPIQVHVGSAVLLVALIVWHLVRHRRQTLRRTDLTRRRLLTTGVFVAGVGAAYAALEGVGRLAGSVSARRVSTGSHRIEPAAIPATIWLFDRTPRLGADHVVRVGDRTFTPDQLDALGSHVQARLDCTSGWYADGEWTGAPISDLLTPGPGGSIVVTSVTGYRRRFAADEADRLWLVTRSQGARLDAGHGGPARLVAPGYRGFWWVKWVASVELSDHPAQAQSPFPLH